MNEKSGSDGEAPPSGRPKATTAIPPSTGEDSPVPQASPVGGGVSRVRVTVPRFVQYDQSMGAGTEQGTPVVSERAEGSRMNTTSGAAGVGWAMEGFPSCPPIWRRSLMC